MRSSNLLASSPPCRWTPIAECIHAHRRPARRIRPLARLPDESARVMAVRLRYVCAHSTRTQWNPAGSQTRLRPPRAAGGRLEGTAGDAAGECGASNSAQRTPVHCQDETAYRGLCTPSTGRFDPPAPSCWLSLRVLRSGRKISCTKASRAGRAQEEKGGGEGARQWTRQGEKAIMLVRATEKEEREAPATVRGSVETTAASR